MLFAVLALGIYLPHIVHGGWYLDDWIDIAQLTETHGLLDAFKVMDASTYRPGLALSLSLIYEVAGKDPAGYLTIGALLAAAQGWVFYLVLRTLKLRITIAAIAAAMLVVLPVIDATRLWYAAFPTQVSGGLYLLGTLVALRGIVNETGRRAALWHGCAAVLYCASVLTYELSAGLVVVTAVLYAVISGWRPALRRWPVDLASIAVAMAIMAPQGAAEREAQTSLTFVWDRATQTLTQAEVVFRWLLPLPHVLGGQIGFVLLIFGMLGAGIAIGRRDAVGIGLLRWARIAGLSALFSLAGLVMLLPADSYYVPHISGVANRSGAAAAFGAVVLLMALIALAAGGLGTLFRTPKLGIAAGAVLVLVTCVNLGVREVRQQRAWSDAWQQQREIIATVGETLGGSVPANASIVTFGHETVLEPSGVVVFTASWDLRGALWETYDRPEVAARPWQEDARCEPFGLAFPDEVESRLFSYRKLFFIDISTRTARRILNRAACRATVEAITGQVVS